MTPSSAETVLLTAISRLKKDYGLLPVIAVEIEFYLIGAKEGDLDGFVRALGAACDKEKIPLAKWEEEQGEEQYEVALAYTRDPIEAVRQGIALKRVILEQAGKFGMKADFAAKPFPDRHGSGLHIHVHLEEGNRESVFYKKDDKMSDALRYSIGGLLATLQEAMVLFAPSQGSYARYVQGVNAPLTMSWGANNRTVAIRLPDTGSPNRHIEHRVAGADADIAKVCAAILSGIYVGLEEKIDPGSQTYGDVSRGEHGLPQLPHSLSEAKQHYQAEGSLFKKHKFYL